MWFSVSYLSRGNSPTRSVADTLWEETILLVEADTAEDAAAKALGCAKAADTDYITATGEQMNWAVRRIERVYEIGESLSSGIEIFSRFLRNSEVESLFTPFDG